jgi:segregation and condensation protein B
VQPAGGLDGDDELRAGGELAAGDPTARRESTDGGAVASGGPAGGAGSSGGGYSDGAGRTTVDSGAAAGGLGATDGDAVEPAAVALVGEGPVAAEDAGDGSSDHAAGEGSGGAVQPELDELADPDRLRSAVEAVLLVIDTPTSAQMLAQILGRSVPEVEGALHSLRDDYDAGARGFDLREVADGWRLYSRDEFAGYVERFVLDGQRARLTQAALETLAVIAYRQPVTRSRISAIRGVSVDAVMRTLLTRGLVEECGADPDTGGGLYRTTSLFLEKMGLRSLDELPSLAPLLPDTSQLDDVELST